MAAHQIIIVTGFIGLFTAAVIAEAAPEQSFFSQADPPIRVLAVESSSSLLVRPDGEWWLSDAAGKNLVRLPHATTTTITMGGGGLRAENGAPTTSFSLSLGKKHINLKSETTSSIIEIGAPVGKMSAYSGPITLKSNPEQNLEAVVTIPLEDYLRGVVPSEIGADAPEQAKFAQAVAARSFAALALKNRKHRGTDYDICSTVHCQVYSGLSRATAASDASVSRTRGIVLTFEGSPIPAYYSSMCAGHTEDIRNVWPARGNERAYHGMARFDGPEPASFDLSQEEDFRKALAAKPASYCNPEKFKVLNWAGRNFRWRREFTAEQVSAFVAKEKEIGRVLSIKPARRGKSGRLTSAEFEGEKGSVTIAPEIVIRRLFKPALKSGAFAIETSGTAQRPSHFIFHGGGSGHGVGMCPTGAMGMANAGKTFREILEHYYSTAELKNLY